MQGESGVTRSIINELHSLDIQRDQREGEGGATQSIIDGVNFFGYPRRSNGR